LLKEESAWSPSLLKMLPASIVKTLSAQIVAHQDQLLVQFAKKVLL